MKRIPLWATLVPLAVGLAAYGWYWDRERDAFQQALTPLFGEGVTVGGFPYRLEAEVANPRLSHNGQYVLDVRAARLQANRQPWGGTLTSIGLLQPSVAWRVPGLNGAMFAVSSATGHSSLRLDGERIVRLSNVHSDARVRLPLLPIAATAASFEWHFRETPSAPDPTSRAPTFPEQAQLVLAADGFRIGTGDPLKMTAQIGLTSSAPIWELTSWRRGGTAELRRLTLADKHGEILTLSATATATLDAPLRIAGTIDTVCPATVTAAFAGTARPAREYRTRKPTKLAFGGAAGEIMLMPSTEQRQLPVRAQEPPCPKLN